MKNEVKKLKALNVEHNKKCVESYQPVNKLRAEFRDFQPYGVKINGINPKSNERRRFLGPVRLLYKIWKLLQMLFYNKTQFDNINWR